MCDQVPETDQVQYGFNFMEWALSQISHLFVAPTIFVQPLHHGRSKLGWWLSFSYDSMQSTKDVVPVLKLLEEEQRLNVGTTYACLPMFKVLYRCCLQQWDPALVCGEQILVLAAA